MIRILLTASVFTYSSVILCQEQTTNALPFESIYAYGMDANLQPVLDILDTSGLRSNKDKEFKKNFVTRFGNEVDESIYQPSGNQELDTLLKYFREYWRMSLLDTETNYMEKLGAWVMPFMAANYPPFRMPEHRDSLGSYLADYIRSMGYFTTRQVNPTGRLVDLLIWKKQTDSTFQVQLSEKESIDVRVVFMEDFITLGWMQHATLGSHHPGGWTTNDALFCVKNSYQLDSENFRVSYLAHEARHFADKSKFQDLSDKDLEYRAKLTELTLAEDSLLDLIAFFIRNSNSKSTNGHSLANHQLIADLSNALFKQAYVSEMEKWRSIPAREIQETADKLLAVHTGLLLK